MTQEELFAQAREDQSWRLPVELLKVQLKPLWEKIIDAAIAARIDRMDGPQKAAVRTDPLHSGDHNFSPPGGTAN